MNSWTIFYWGWWIAWCPLVGMFIAKISVGRTVTEFIGGTMVAPDTIALHLAELWVRLHNVHNPALISSACQT